MINQSKQTIIRIGLKFLIQRPDIDKIYLYVIVSFNLKYQLLLDEKK